MKRMGFQPQMINGKYPVYDFENKIVADIGGGPCSVLLKGINLKKGYVIDPCDYPKWVGLRYKDAGLEYLKIKGEDIGELEVDEAMIYNCLQHTQDVEKILTNARRISKIVRIFEWIDMPVSEGHPQVLTEERLNKALGGIGKIEEINENGAHGKCYYGIFKGDRYE